MFGSINLSVSHTHTLTKTFKWPGKAAPSFNLHFGWRSCSPIILPEPICHLMGVEDGGWPCRIMHKEFHLSKYYRIWPCAFIFHVYVAHSFSQYICCSIMSMLSGRRYRIEESKWHWVTIHIKLWCRNVLFENIVCGAGLSIKANYFFSDQEECYLVLGRFLWNVHLLYNFIIGKYFLQITFISGLLRYWLKWSTLSSSLCFDN